MCVCMSSHPPKLQPHPVTSRVFLLPTSSSCCSWLWFLRCVLHSTSTLAIGLGRVEESLGLFLCELLHSPALLSFPATLLFLLPLLLSQMQKQNMLALTSKDLHSTWEEHLKSRSHLEEHAAHLDKEKAELLEQVSPENYLGTEPIPRRTTCTFWSGSYILIVFCYPCHSGCEYLIVWGSWRKQIKARWVSLCKFWSGSVGKSSQLLPLGREGSNAAITRKNSVQLALPKVTP